MTGPLIHDQRGNNPVKSPDKPLNTTSDAIRGPVLYDQHAGLTGTQVAHRRDLGQIKAPDSDETAGAVRSDQCNRSSTDITMAGPTGVSLGKAGTARATAALDKLTMKDLTQHVLKLQSELWLMTDERDCYRHIVRKMRAADTGEGW